MEKLVDLKTLQSYYQGKKVFVTGHTGFKGGWLMAWLSKLGATTKGYALAPENEKSIFNMLEPMHLFESVIADIRDKEKLEKEIVEFRPDFIFHLAAQPLVRRSYKIPAETFEVNVTGTANLLEVVTKLKHPCTVIVITTDKVYENKELDILYKESDRLGGYDPYSASKAAAELVVSSFRNSFFNPADIEKHKIALSSVRAGNVIGGGDFNEDRIIPDIIKALENGSVIEVRNPFAVRPWQHVLEPLGGYLMLGGLMQKDPLQYSGAYNFGPLASDHLTVKELVGQAISTWGNGEWKDTGSVGEPHEANLLKLDIKKAMDALQWQPKLNAREAIAWTVNWYKEKNNKAQFTFDQIKSYMEL